MLATEKKMPSILVDEQSLHKVVKLNDKIGMVYSGMGPDSRVLMNKGRKLAQQYFRVRVLSFSSFFSLFAFFGRMSIAVMLSRKSNSYGHVRSRRAASLSAVLIMLWTNIYLGFPSSNCIILLFPSPFP